MNIRGLVDEDLLQYKKPSMFIITSYCDFKCEKEFNCTGMCQNSHITKLPIIDFNNDCLVDRYLSNSITKAIVFGGLEPLDQFQELYELIKKFRFKTDDDIVIYTGYYEDEILDNINKLKVFKNIIIKYGRYIPNRELHFDTILGVELASENQFAKKLS